MAESGIDVRDADVLIGTSSGARVALQLASGAPLEEVFARQIGAGRHFGAAPHAGRQSGAVDMSRVQQEVARAKELGGDRAEGDPAALWATGPHARGTGPAGAGDDPVADGGLAGAARAADRVECRDRPPPGV